MCFFVLCFFVPNFVVPCFFVLCFLSSPSCVYSLFLYCIQHSLLRVSYLSVLSLYTYFLVFINPFSVFCLSTVIKAFLLLHISSDFICVCLYSVFSYLFSSVGFCLQLFFVFSCLLYLVVFCLQWSFVFNGLLLYLYLNPTSSDHLVAVMLC